MKATTTNSRNIRASQETLYQAFTDPKALAIWLAPGDMTGTIHNFDLKVGGGYTMSLFYPDSEQELKGKTSGREDRFTAKFVELTPFSKIIQSINFHSDNRDFTGEMIMEVTLDPKDSWTKVTITFKNIPTGINPKDNELGTELSLDKLEKYIQ